MSDKTTLVVVVEWQLPIGQLIREQNRAAFLPNHSHT
jgi:hypothetical protein